MAAEWYFKELGKACGPVTSADLRRLALEGRIGPETWVRKGSDGRWAPASKVKGLFRAYSYPGDSWEQEQRPLHPQPVPRPKPPVHVDPRPLYPPPIPRSAPVARPAPPVHVSRVPEENEPEVYSPPVPRLPSKIRVEEDGEFNGTPPKGVSPGPLIGAGVGSFTVLVIGLILLMVSLLDKSDKLSQDQAIKPTTPSPSDVERERQARLAEEKRRAKEEEEKREREARSAEEKRREEERLAEIERQRQEEESRRREAARRAELAKASLLDIADDPEKYVGITFTFLVWVNGSRIGRCKKKNDEDRVVVDGYVLEFSPGERDPNKADSIGLSWGVLPDRLHPFISSKEVARALQDVLEPGYFRFRVTFTVRSVVLNEWPQLGKRSVAYLAEISKIERP